MDGNAAQLTTLVAGSVLGPSNSADQGVTKTFPVAVTASVNGTSTNQTSFLLDGIPNNELLSNVNLQFPMSNALQEFSVQTSNYSAEYGQNAGGVVNIVTRVGTNGFHGDISIISGTVRSMPATSLHPQSIKKTLPRMTGRAEWRHIADVSACICARRIMSFARIIRRANRKS